MATKEDLKYAAREVPEEIRYYRWVDGNVEAAGARRLSPYEQRIVRMYEAQHSQMIENYDGCRHSRVETFRQVFEEGRLKEFMKIPRHSLHSLDLG
jgi:hypothetical protein